MTGLYLGETEDILLHRKEASTELLRMGIRRSPATLAKIFSNPIRRPALYASEPDALLSASEAA